jgi:multidrug efflux system membrane fusion protein
VVRRGVAIVAAGGVLAAGIGVWLALERPTPSAAAPGPTAAAPVPVSIGEVTAADVPIFVNGIGTVQAFNAVAIKSRVDGAIVRVDFAEGQEVEAGARLFQIDPRPYQAALAQAQAAKARDAAQLQGAQLDLERFSKLVGNGFQTRQSVDQQTALVAQLKAATAGDQAQIDMAQLNLDYAEIRAPIAGRLSARLVDVGNLVRATDATALVTIAQLKPIFVSFTLPQQNFDGLRRQQLKAPLAVEVLTADNTQELAHGELTLIDNTIDAATGTIHLKARFANEDERLWPGEFVNVRVTLDTRHGVPTIAMQALQEGPEGYVVYVVDPDNTARRRIIEVAGIQDGIAAVTKGLAAGDRVVVDGQFRLTDGARVAPAPARATASRR